MIGFVLLGLLSAADDGTGGDDAVAQQVRLSLRAGAIQVDYSLQLGRQAAFAEVLQIDRDRDGRFSPEEQAAYFTALEQTILGGLELRLDGRDLTLRRVGELRLEMPFRKIYRFEAACPSAGRMEFHNENFPDSPGAAAIVVDAPEGMDLLLDGDPGALRRDLAGELRSGTGVVEWRRLDARLAVPSARVGISLRVLALAGFLGGALLAFRRRRGAAVLSWATAAACGAAAIVATLPSSSEAERIFRILHEESARAAEPTLRRLKPLETRIVPSFACWTPEFKVRHRWAAYGSVTHSGHGHAETKEREGRFRVRWSGGSWHLVGDYLGAS